MPALALRLHDVDVDFDTAIPTFLEGCTLRGLSPKTVQFYAYALGPFAAHAREHGAEVLTAVTPPLVRSFLGRMQAQGATPRGGVGPGRLNDYAEAIRLFYDWAVAEGYSDHNPARGLPKAREGRKVIPTFSEDELRALLRQPDRSTFLGLRDHTFMLLLADTGLRLSEALGLQVADLHLSSGSAKVLGKGGRERLVGLSGALARHLKHYLAMREATVRRAGCPAECLWLFPNQEGSRWNAKGAQMRLKLYGRQAGVTGVRVSPHTFRHTFAVWFVRNGGSAFHLQRILGHSDLTMTRRYCELADTDALDRQRELSPLVTMNLAPTPGGRLR
jgi:integrase/recombinase XerD